MKNSKFLSLNIPDFVKAALLAGLAIVVTSLYQGLAATPPSLPTWPEFVSTLKLAGATAGIYLLKNLITNSDGAPMKSEQKPSNFPNNARL